MLLPHLTPPARRARARRRRAFALPLVAALTAAAAATACSDSSSPTSTRAAADLCADAGATALGVLQGATYDCSAGTGVELAGSGATYLVVPEFAVGDRGDSTVSFALDVPGLTASGALVAAADVGTAQSSPTSPMARWTSTHAVPGARQRAFDGFLRSRARDAVGGGAWRILGPAGAGSRGTGVVPRANVVAAAVTLPALNSVRQFSVIGDIKGKSLKTVTARLAYIGANVLLYVDTLAPASGFSAGQLSGFGALFDQTLYPIDVAAFGAPADVDQNGRVVMLLSPAVNALSPAATCKTQGFIAGFFDPFDFSTQQGSNRGEVFYGIVPDAGATVGCAHTVSDLLQTLPATFLHELQHLINYSQHVVVHRGREEDGWLDEGLSLRAEEMGSEYYEARFPPPSGRTDPKQIFPDSSEGFVGELLFDSYDFLQRPDTAALTYHSDSDDGLAWRAGDWLLVRWLGDQKGSDVYKRLEQTSLTGTANIASAAGEPFPSLFGDFGLALYVDSLPGVPRSSIPAADRFTTRNLRQLYQRLFETAGPQNGVPSPYPVVPEVLGATTTGSMKPGTMRFYELTTPANASSVVVRFTKSATGGTAAAGGAFGAGLHPQLAIFRLK